MCEFEHFCERFVHAEAFVILACYYVRSGRNGTQVRMITVIVGGSASIGLPMIDAFLEAGSDVVATFNRRVPAQSGNASWHHLDLTVPKSIADFAQTCPPVDALVLVSGKTPRVSLDDYDEDLIGSINDVNFLGLFRLLKRLRPKFTDRSRVVAISSISGQSGSYDPLYAASKGALLALVKSLARYLAPTTTIVAVAPSLIEDSRMYEDMEENVRASHLSSTPLGKLLQAEDLARVVVDLTRPHWHHVNGACIDINGGQYVR